MQNKIPQRLFNSGKGCLQQQNLGPHAQVLPIRIPNAVQIVKENMKTSALPISESMLYLGIGQYFNDPQRERVVILHASSEFSGYPHAVILDGSLASSDVNALMKELELIHTNFSHGEINSVDKSCWKYGFTVQPNFRIFTEQSWHCDLLSDRLRILSNESFEEIALADIVSVNVHVSEEPWDQQAIEIQLKDDSYCGLMHLEVSNEKRDLAMLMIDTEWTVKAAAILCLKIKQLGHKVDLRLPKELTIQGNPWVQDRHNSWTRLITSV